MIGDCWISATCDTGYELKVRGVKQGKKKRTEEEKQQSDVFLLFHKTFLASLYAHIPLPSPHQ